MPKSKRRLPEAGTETISRPTPVAAEEGGAVNDDDGMEDVDSSAELDERQVVADEGGDARETANDSVPDADDFRALLQAELTADTIQHYLNRISVKPLLTVEEEQRYSRLAKAGEFEARQVMIERNLRRVI